MRQRLAPLGDRVECRLIDATTLPEDSAFDLALARRAVQRHRHAWPQPGDSPPAAARRPGPPGRAPARILLAALRAVRPGGRVVYSTCSLEPEENEQVVAAVLAETPNARQLFRWNPASMPCLAKASSPPPARSVCKAALTPEGALRLLPGVFPTDGFFIALIEKAV